MIEKHFDALERIIIGDPLVVFPDFSRVYTSPQTAYIKGKFTFIDSSLLSFFQHVRLKEEKVIITDYRYHYMDSESRIIFRYDSAPHYPDLKTFPHHKHLPSEERESEMPALKSS